MTFHRRLNPRFTGRNTPENPPVFQAVRNYFRPATDDEKITKDMLDEAGVELSLVAAADAPDDPAD